MNPFIGSPGFTNIFLVHCTKIAPSSNINCCFRHGDDGDVGDDALL